MPMKIAINCRLLLKNKLEGIGWYTFEIVKRIAQSHPEHDFYFLFDRPFHSDFIFSKNVTPIILSNVKKVEKIPLASAPASFAKRK